MGEGDVIDRISKEQSNDVTLVLGRVKVLSIGEKTNKGNQRVELERWKQMVIPKQDYRTS